MLSSYSYLGLLQHPAIEQAASAIIKQHGVGTHGVRLLAGTLSIHKQLEQHLQQFANKAAAVVLASGYMTNLSAITALVGRGDYVLFDRLSHASIYDAVRLSGATSIRFNHNDTSDLEQQLQRLPCHNNKLIITDAVFSMDGDICPLPAILTLARQYGALLMVDEAHAIGVLGATGRGIEEHFGIPLGSIDIKMGTLSKAIPAMGGYIAANAEIIDLIKHQGRAFIYSAALSPVLAAAALAAFDVLAQEPWRLTRLRNNTHYFTQALNKMGFDTLNTATAIIPILCGKNETAWRMARLCQDQDIFVQGIPTPVVPPGTARLRCVTTAAHSQAELNQALVVLKQAGETLGLI